MADAAPDMAAKLDGLSVAPDVFATPYAAKLFSSFGVLHVKNAVPRETQVRLDRRICEILDSLEGRVGERIPYISAFPSENKEDMRLACKELDEALNDILSPDFPFIDPILNLVDCKQVLATVGYAREARPTGGASAHCGYHQDYPSFVRFTDFDKRFDPKRTLTIWFPLCEIDSRTPGIEYVPAYLDQELPNDEGGQLDVGVVDVDSDRLPKWVPKATIGDFCVHDQYTLHRSHVLPGMDKLRRSFELRLYMR